MSYEDKIKTTKVFHGTTRDLLRFSIDNEDKKATGCIGWEFLKVNLTNEIKAILLSKKYLDITYNSENVNLITEEFNLDLDDELKSQLGSLVYIWKDIKREEDKKKSEGELKTKLLKEGFSYVDFLKYEHRESDEDFKKRTKAVYEKLDGLKVVCVLDVSKIGLMGSFDSIERIEGKFSYCEHNGNLMFLPGKNRSRGYLIRGRFYFKEVKH